MHYYICYKGRRLIGPILSREEAIQQLFEIRGAFKDLYVEIVDPGTGKRIGTMGRKKKG